MLFVTDKVNLRQKGWSSDNIKLNLIEMLGGKYTINSVVKKIDSCTKGSQYPVKTLWLKEKT